MPHAYYAYLSLPVALSTAAGEYLKIAYNYMLEQPRSSNSVKHKVLV